MDEAPAFGQSSYDFSLAENADGSANRVSLGTVSAADPEGAAVEYSLVAGNGAGLFEVDAATGELFYTGSGEDYESDATSFDLTVRASDGDQSTDTTVTVSVTDVEEDPANEPAVPQVGQSVSEPSGEDFSADTSTAGRVAVGGTATGNIGASGDRDWFAVELVAGRTYTIDLRGSPTDDGTLSDPYLRGVYDADGNLIPGTTNDDGGLGYNSRLTFAATESGTHYIAAGAYYGRGTYEVEVSDNSPPDTQDQVQEPPVVLPVVSLVGVEFSADTSTEGRVAVGETATGNIGSDGDRDWFAVELVAGRTYTIDLMGSGTDDGTLGDPYLRGIHDADGNLIPRTADDNGGEGNNSRVTFTATDSGTHYIDVGAFSGTGSYTVAVRDDTPELDQPGVAEAPVFEQPDYTFELRENEDGSTNRVSLGTVSATDTESPPVSYSLVSGNGAGLFEIDAASGELFYAGSGEDYESGSTQFDLTVRASDGTQSTDTTVTVNVANVEEAPAFGQQDYAFALSENVDGSTNRVSLGTVSATDPEGAALSYSLEGGNESGLFELDAQTGELFYAGSGEDYESGATSFDLTVRASDGDQSTDTIVTVSVTDVQEDPADEPAVPQVGQSVSEPTGEDFSADTSTAGRVAVGGTATGNIGASGDRDWLAVELVAGRTYTIDLRGSPTGDGTLRDPYLRGVYDANGNLIPGTTNDDGGLGYNSRLTFTATASGTHYIAAGAYSGRGTYEVEVTDNSPADTQEQQVVQEPPAFGQQDYAFELAENSDGSATRISLGTVSATDPEGATLSYSLVGGNESGLFELDAQTGELFYVGVGEDYESGATSFDLTVRASDGDQSTDTTVTVSVTDVQEDLADEPAAPQVGQSVSEPSGEDFSADTSTAGRVAVGGTATGNIGASGDRDWFAVELVAGRTYTIDLRGSPTGDGTLGDPYLRGVYDADGGYIRGTRNDDGGEGTNSRLTFTATTSGTHYIAAGGFSSSLLYSSRGTYEVEVTESSPVQNEPPAFGQQGYAFELAENADGSSTLVSLGTVSATDPEGRGHGYSLVGGNEAGLFELDAQTGELFYVGPGEDYESGSTQFDLTVRAWDGEHSVDTAVTVRVTDVQEDPADEPAVPQVGQSVSEPFGEDFSAGRSTPGRVAVDGSVTGRISSERDKDWFAVELEGGTDLSDRP